jgi:energy-coupling factor transporter ATP-binding protein EcfA2
MGTDGVSDRVHNFLMQGLGIRQIVVERLFGQFTYELKDKISPHGSASRVLLLYGDNGSGKTTILRILFYLLSHIDKQGHKSEIHEIRFRKFLIQFADGTDVVAARQQDRDRGYSVKITRAGKVLAQASYFQEERPASGNTRELLDYYKRKELHDVEHENLLQTLKALNLGMIYLSDSRNIFTTNPNINHPGTDEGSEDSISVVRSLRAASARESSSALARAVEQVSSWATRQAFKGSAQGEEDVNSVYANIISRLYAPQQLQTSDLTAAINILEEQQQRSADFVRFGLTKPLKVREIVTSLLNMNSLSQNTALAILQPYITGVKARLDALEPIRVQLAGFVDTMNSFYRNKSVQVDVNQGMVISSQNGERLHPGMLSSGEGQLLFLLASIIVAKDQSSLFMIDEPEISLNVRWQRQLIRSLLELTRDSKIQFLLATHSIELLTRYSDCVLDLENIDK